MGAIEATEGLVGVGCGEPSRAGNGSKGVDEEGSKDGDGGRDDGGAGMTSGREGASMGRQV